MPNIAARHPAIELPEERQAVTEWRTWHQVCAQLRGLGVDINADSSKALHRAVILWGEELAELRALQDSNVGTEALTEARLNYLPHVIEHP